MTPEDSPLVTIGIPTFNRVGLLRRALDSALGQQGARVEVLVSDNASTDGTQALCLEIGARDTRLRYFRRQSNVGATRNFMELPGKASGEFFMWLADDDWLDHDYVAGCLSALLSDPGCSLACGQTLYYRDGRPSRPGERLHLRQRRPFARVTAYYAQVHDNGIFYSLMRTRQVCEVRLTQTMGSDWLFIAALLHSGHATFLPETHAHRELGGATASINQMTRSLGLSWLQGRFPMTSIAVNACQDIVWRNPPFRRAALPTRLATACAAVFAIALNALYSYGHRGLERLGLAGPRL